MFTYSFLGFIAGFAGKQLSAASSTLVDVQQWLSIAAGAMMILIGLSTLGSFRIRFALPNGVAQPFAKFYRHFLRSPGMSTVFIAGTLNGFLPCGLVYAFLGLSLASGDLLRGALLMFFFGLGTVPAMTVVGCGGSLLGHATRAKLFRVAACLVLISGGVTIYRAIPSKHNCCGAEAPVDLVSTN